MPLAAGARHQAASRGRGREVAPPLSPEAVAAKRCAEWVAAAVRAADDPEQALGALHAARRQVREGRTRAAAAAQLTRALSFPLFAPARCADRPRKGRRTRTRLRGAAEQVRRPRARLSSAGAAHGGLISTLTAFRRSCSLLSTERFRRCTSTTSAPASRWRTARCGPPAARPAQKPRTPHAARLVCIAAPTCTMLGAPPTPHAAAACPHTVAHSALCFRGAACSPTRCCAG